MNTDDLERRLRRLDPAQGDEVDPATGPRAAALMEQIMNTTDVPTTTVHEPERRRARWPRFAIGGALAAVIAAGAFAFAGGGGGGSPTAVTYQLGAPDIMAMCLTITEYVPPATGLEGFRGTVVEVGDTTVTLDVTKWYSEGSADQVVLQVADMPLVALDGVEFTPGGDYLVSVLDGTVQICGLSGPYSAEFEAIFASWFPA